MNASSIVEWVLVVKSSVLPGIAGYRLKAASTRQDRILFPLFLSVLVSLTFS